MILSAQKLAESSNLLKCACDLAGCMLVVIILDLQGTHILSTFPVICKSLDCFSSSGICQLNQHYKNRENKNIMLLQQNFWEYQVEEITERLVIPDSHFQIFVVFYSKLCCLCLLIFLSSMGYRLFTKVGGKSVVQAIMVIQCIFLLFSKGLVWLRKYKMLQNLTPIYPFLFLSFQGFLSI